MIKTLKTTAFLLEKIVSFLCVVIIGAMTVTVLLGVLFRYVFLNPLGWTEELARYLMIWGASLAISLGVKNNEHVGLTILIDSIKSRFLILLMDLIITILVFAFLLLMIIYGSLMNVSIAGLFAAGFIPGFVLAILLMIMAGLISARRGYPKSKKTNFKQKLVGFKDAIIPLLMPVIILGGILSGVFTPTEAAAIAVAYAFLVGFFVLRSLKLKHIPEMFIRTARVTGVVFLIIGTASILSWVLSFNQVPQMIASFLLSITDNPSIILLLIILLMLIVGMFMDIAAALIILGPILHPIAVEMGVAPIHFGIIMVLSLNIALMTPPVGACLFVACSITKLKLSQISKAIFPFIIMEVIALFIIAFIPQISMFLPGLLGF